MRSRLVLLALLTTTPGIARSEGATSGPPGVSSRWLTGQAHPFALRKLERQECQGVLMDFRDLEGRTLRSVLADSGVSPVEFFDSLLFADGGHAEACHRDRVFAATVRGSRVILVCPGFRELSAGNPSLAADILIHEMLHDLGLGENPPSSQEITLRVRRRCWP